VVEISRNIDVIFHYKDEFEKKKTFQVLPKEMHADFFTKSTANPQYTKLVNSLMYGNFPNMGEVNAMFPYEHFFISCQLNRIQ
jgi:competence CoiA-like predicted nuclease